MNKGTLPVLDCNAKVRAKFQNAYDKICETHKGLRGQAAVEHFAGPKNNPANLPIREAFSAYIERVIDIYLTATSGILNYGRVTSYEPEDVPRYSWMYKQTIKLYEGAAHGGIPSSHDMPAGSYHIIQPDNYFTEKLEVPVDAVELGNIFSTNIFEDLVRRGRDELDIQMRQGVWTLLANSALTDFGSNPVFQAHPSIQTSRIITGNDYDWQTGQANPFGGANFTDGFTIAKLKALISLTAGMIGNDGRPLSIKRIVVPNGSALRYDIMNWPGSASTAGGIPEGILEQIWNGTWLFHPETVSGELRPLSGTIIEEDATIPDDYIWVFTNEPAFETAVWRQGNREFRRNPDYEHPDTYGFFATGKWKHYMPSPYLMRWLRIRIHS